MTLSMPSFLAGVGTVAGAVLLGFGGGIFLSNTAMKDTPSAPTRIERVVGAKPAAATTEMVKAENPKANAAAVEAQSAPVQNVATPAVVPAVAVGSASTVAVDVPAAKAPDVARAEPSVQASVEPPAQAAAEPDRRGDERRAQRRAERQKRNAERKARAMAKRLQPQVEAPAQPELAFEQREAPPLFDLFQNQRDPAPQRGGLIQVDRED